MREALYEGLEHSKVSALCGLVVGHYGNYGVMQGGSEGGSLPQVVARRAKCVRHLYL